MLESIIVPPRGKATASVIWLHGLGADGSDFSDVIPSLGLPENHGIRFIFPHAPIQAVTINRGMKMPAWYDIAAIDSDLPEDEIGLKAAQAAIYALMEKEHAQAIPYARMILIGFSQGGALALYSALRFKHTLAGAGALSAYLPLHKQLDREASLENKQIPILMAHGTQDPLVPYALGRFSFNCLQQLGFRPLWQEYPMAHSVCLPELAAIGKWIESCLTLK